MLKAMIVDDERIIRIGISSMIKWNVLGLTLVGEAANGEEGYELFCREEPDIVITDIRMPGINGIEMMKKIKRKSPNVKFVILSGHEDFSYAKDAIHLGVSEYLIKSDLMPEDIEAILQKIIREILSVKENLKNFENEQDRVHIRTIVSELCNGIRNLDEEDINEEELVAFQNGYCCLCIGIKDSGLRNLERHGGKSMLKLESYLNHSFKKFQVVSFINNNLLGAVLFLNQDNELLLDAILKDCISHVKEHMGFILTIGKSLVNVKIEEIHTAYVQASQSYHQRMFYGCGKVITYDGINQTLKVAQKNAYDFKSIEKIMDYLDDRKLQIHLDQIFHELKGKHNYEEVNMVAMELFVLMNKISGALYSEEVLFERKKLLYQQLTLWEEIDEIAEWFKHEFQLLLEESRNKITDNRNITSYLKRYIEENYERDITLQSLGEIVHLNKNYVGNLFKKDIGKSVNEYILYVRMEHAKELLSQSNLKANIIANKVGYEDERYFYKLFKKMTGYTTMDYIKKYRI